MLYEAKQGTKTYEYIKGILDAEKRERQAYMERVKEAVGFEFDDYLRVLPNDSNDRKVEITYIWVSLKQYETLDKKAWRQTSRDKRVDGLYIAIVPNTRYKQGKLLASVLDSYKPVIGKDEITKELKIDESQVSPLGNTIMIFRRNDRILVSFDDRARVEECNLDFKKVETDGYLNFVYSDKRK